MEKLTDTQLFKNKRTICRKKKMSVNSKFNFFEIIDIISQFHKFQLLKYNFGDSLKGDNII